MTQKMFTIRQASKAIGRQERTVRGWIHDGKLSAVKNQSGRMWMIPESEIKRVTEEQHVYEN